MSDLPACPHCGRSLGFRVDGTETAVVNLYYWQSGVFEESFHHSVQIELGTAVKCLACKQVRTDVRMEGGAIVLREEQGNVDSELHHEDPR